ncbi:DUF6573 family protein [Streptomyces sp. NRRL S-350]|uniref:DUF6573 family protein n=1 Tax=Streptomyces sp. NRRL S-350 TaxID=1463902 RepID=UPI0004C17B16|nr:DUF6573 family protein [Streptomyces sp. NRRL S-350]
MTSLTELYGEPIHQFTRADALEAGDLMEAPRDLAQEAGWRWPVALTRAAWGDCVAWSSEDDARHPGHGQSETGRLWDVLRMAFYAVRSANPGVRAVPFEVLRIPAEGPSRATRARLAVHCGPGDSGETVITIMQPDES